MQKQVLMLCEVPLGIFLFFCILCVAFGVAFGVAMWFLKLTHGPNHKLRHRIEARQMGMGLKLRRNHNQRTTSAFRVHCRPIKLILGSKEAEETNLLEFI
jgi:hypothetical protein